MTGPWSEAVALAVATGAVALLLRLRGRLPHDRPNARSLHATPVPRAGGLAIWAGALPSLVLWAAALPPAAAAWWAIAWLAAFAVSLVDDWRGAAASVRLGVHLAAALCATAGIAAMGDHGPAFPWQAQVACALAIAWSANLFNFMDGIDGLAGAMAAIGFCSYALAAAFGEATAPPFAAIALAALPFLAVNWPPARLFMGDAGAVPLGLLAAAFGILGVRAGIWPAWFPLLAFLPFLLDATLTLARRAWRRERVWEAHRSHYYQRLHRLRSPGNGALATYVALMLGCAATALACLRFAPHAGWPALAAWCAAHGALFAAIDYHWRKSAPSR